MGVPATISIEILSSLSIKSLGLGFISEICTFKKLSLGHTSRKKRTLSCGKGQGVEKKNHTTLIPIASPSLYPAPLWEHM